MEESKLVVIIPAFNEEKTIGNVICKIKDVASVLVVDDYSSDNTRKISIKAGAKVITNNKNLGYEKSLNIGFYSAIHDLDAFAVITMDADGEHDGENIETFKRLLIDDGVPLVFGKRKEIYRLSEKLIGFLMYKFFKISDIFCGMKGYNSKIWLKRGYFDRGNCVGAELALSAVRGGAKFTELEVTGKKRIDDARFGYGLTVTHRLIKAILISLMSKKILFNDD